MDTSQAIKIIRKELVVKDQPLKAWKLLELFQDVPGLEEERKNTYGMVRHVFDDEEYRKACDVPADDCELIEPETVIDNPVSKFHRYGWMMKEIEKENPKTYLDLGCYVGSLVIWASLKGIKAFGVDYTPKVIEAAQRRAKARNSTAKFFIDDIRRFNKVKADLVSCFEVLEHLPDVEKFVSHLADLSKGWVYLSTPDGPYGNGEGNIKQGWEWDGKGVRGHLRVFTHETMKQLLKDYEIGEMFTDDGGLLCVEYKKKNSL